jgi:LysM repeat protein
MNNDQSNSHSPFLDAKQPGRSRVKVAVFSVLAVHVAGLTALLLTQGCKREAQPEVEPTTPDLLDTNSSLFYTDTNLPPSDFNTNTAYMPPVQDPFAAPGGATPPPMTPPAGTSEYVVKSGDSFYTIAKAHGTTVKAIETANPGVDSRRLKIGQKLVLPAPGTGAIAPATSSLVDSNVYVVKSGDTLSRIATAHKTTVKELKAINGLTTDRINVGQKLKLPPPAAPAPAPLTEPLPPAPALPPTTTLPPGQ